MNRTKLALLVVSCISVGFFAGYSIGGMMALTWCVDTGLKIMEVNGIEVDLSKELIRAALFTGKI